MGAFYFPPTPKTFAEVMAKFDDDLKGVQKNNADGIAFVTNQRLTPSERDSLRARATSEDATADLVHLEHACALLDSPRGYGLRLQYLRIAMNLEEQTAFVADRDGRIEHRLDRIERIVRTVAERVGVEPIGVTMAAGSPPPSRGLLSSMHIAAVRDERMGPGRFRTVQNWVGGPGGLAQATYVPPPPEEVPARIDAMLAGYSLRISGSLLPVSLEQAIEVVASLYAEFLSIHPFLDGNGKVARALARYELGRLCRGYLRSENLQSPAHFDSLAAAMDGDLSKVVEDIKRAASREAP